MKAEHRNEIIEGRDGHPIPVALHMPGDDSELKGNVVLAHGIFSDKDENGRFIRQAQYLNSHGFRVARFDFRGHGDSSIRPEETTVSGMINDLKSVILHIQKSHHEPIYIVASSFGGSITLLYLQTCTEVPIKRIVLLNPVVDYDSTFIHPVGEQIKANFHADAFEELERTGYMNLLPTFTMSEAMLNEMKLMRPYCAFGQLDIPTRIIHGSRDSAVPYEVTWTYGLRSQNVDFQLIEGADHAFDEEPYEQQTFELITEWINGPDVR